MKILIRNLDRDTTESELKEVFEPFGPLQSCSLVLDKATGDSKGFAFVEIPNIGAAKAAIKTLNGLKLGAHTIRVKKAEAK